MIQMINAGFSNTAGTRLILQLLRAGPLSSQLLLQLRLGGSGGDGLQWRQQLAWVGTLEHNCCAHARLRSIAKDAIRCL